MAAAKSRVPFRVEAHYSRQDQIRNGLAFYSQSLPEGYEHNRELIRTPSQASTVADDVGSNAGSASLSSAQNLTSRALRAVYRRQGYQEFLKPTERLPPATPLSLSRPRSCASLGNFESTRRAAGKAPLSQLEQRCDEILETLVRDGDRGGGGWSRGQEMHSRLGSRNRQISQQTAKVQAETKFLTDTLRTEAASGLVDGVDHMRHGVEPSNWPNPIASRTKPMYQSSYDRFYGLRLEPHMETMLSRAKTIRGHELNSTITAWGSEVTLQSNR
eukprot:TRINITY_DN61648_c0_g1_i1.p1 TRINITY_DN61648_c0_g1~~TRINITY_DN61648_c0_g1_i1.p1  ORF type:complete len:317 (-),score=51.30 TRINITY_DN61648_c0_g1_i1:152-970(-)